MNIAIIGGGIAGLSAAYDLLAAGHSVTVYESSSQTGGLARGFKDDLWEWPLEHFYHHIFESDQAIIDLVKELGIEDALFFPTPRTSLYQDGDIVPFSNPVDWWRSGLFGPLNYVRYGLVGVFLRYTKFWRYLEKHTADRWSRRFYGRKIHDALFKPLLIGKFGPYYQDVNMAWLWARLHVRSFKLGYFKGGFQAFIDRLTSVVSAEGGVIHLNMPVRSLAPADADKWQVITDGGQRIYDKVLHTTSPALLARLTSALPESYTRKINALDSMGAVVVTLALKQSLLEDGTYWLNLPAVSTVKEDNAAPFLALVEHTNYIGSEHYGGDTIVYCGDYVTQDHPYLSMGDEALIEKWVDALRTFNKHFEPSWVRKAWVHRASYAQPVPKVGHSENVLPVKAPLPNLYMASMSQVYPWDRGTNFAVEIGRNAAKIILS